MFSIILYRCRLDNLFFSILARREDQMDNKKNRKKLTDKQQKIFDFIRDAIRNEGYPPTVREIGDHFGITVKGAYDHIKAIEKKGFIQTEQNKSRAICLIDQEEEIATDAVNIPLVGRIAAGTPVLAEENIDEYLSFPSSSFKGGDFFALNIHGDSMIECGINDGDIAIIRKQNTADNGDIVAALLEDEATLKRFKLKHNKVHLIPENSAYAPIITEDVLILGKLAGIFRRY